MATSETSRTPSRKGISQVVEGVGFSPTPDRRHDGRLLQIVHSAGKSLRAVARAIAVDPKDVSCFIHHRYHKIGRARRKLIRQYFIEQGWLPKPKPRKPTQCRNCGTQYPTRKFESQSETAKRNSTVTA